MYTPREKYYLSLMYTMYANASIILLLTLMLVHMYEESTPWDCILGNCPWMIRHTHLRCSPLKEDNIIKSLFISWNVQYKGYMIICGINHNNVSSFCSLKAKKIPHDNQASSLTIFFVRNTLIDKTRCVDLYFIGFVCRTKTMHGLLCLKSKFPIHFAFALGHYSFLLFLVQFI